MGWGVEATAVGVTVGVTVRMTVGAAVAERVGALVAEAVGVPGAIVAPLLGVATGLLPKPTGACDNIPLGPAFTGAIEAGGRLALVFDPPEHADKRRDASMSARQ